MGIDIVVGFFLLGAFARLIGSRLEMPTALYQGLTMILMLAIGLKGGIALAENLEVKLLWQSLVVMSLGVLLPFIAYPLLRHVGQLNRYDSASIAAHYGSVSVATYVVAVAVLESQGIAYESYFPLFVVLLEAPAIAVGIALADKKLLRSSGKLAHEILSSEGIVLLGGGLLIGFLYGAQTEKVMPLFGDLFHGVLALFLLHMGIVAASKIQSIIDNGLFIVAFGVFMPLLGATIGTITALLLGFSTGGTILLAVLMASASYIAVPAAMSLALPQANQSLSITASLAVTFPFNVIVGIPVYIGVIQWVTT